MSGVPLSMILLMSMVAVGWRRRILAQGLRGENARRAYSPRPSALRGSGPSGDETAEAGLMPWLLGSRPWRRY
jgi:hypothetical protein